MVKLFKKAANAFIKANYCLARTEIYLYEANRK